MAIKLAPEGVGSFGWWTEQIQWATRVREQKQVLWRRNLDAYLDERVTRAAGDVRVNVEFEKTEQKRAQLFFQVPSIMLKPKRPGLEQAVRIFRQVLNEKLGSNGVNIKAVMRELIFDVLCPAGLGAVRLGYETYEDGVQRVAIGERPVAVPFREPEYEELGQGVPLAESAFEDVPNIIAEQYFVERISPTRLLIPPDFDRSDYSTAPWLGSVFFMDVVEARRRGWIRGEVESHGEDDDRLIDLDRTGVSRQGKIKGQELWYYASRIDPRAVHPERIRRLVFLNGVPHPVVHDDTKWQRWNEQGRLTLGIRTLPIKVLTLRYVSDTPYPPSDCSASRRQADELSEGRTQMSKQRRRAVPLRVVNKGLVDSDTVERLKRGEWQDIIGVDGEITGAIAEIARANYPRENFTFNDYIQGDIDRLWALGANQSGVQQRTSRTATELSLIQRATDTRLSWEQSLVMDFLVSIVRDLGTLIQMFADETEYVEIIGEDGLKHLTAWNRDTIAGEFLYDIKPDSARRPDAASDREAALTGYNLLANDPYINREELVRQTVDILEYDSTRLVRPPEPPPPQIPKVTIAIRGEDLNPFAPQYQNVVNLLQVSGVPGTLTPPQAGGAETTGPADVIDRDSLEVTDQPDQRLGGAGSLQ